MTCPECGRRLGPRNRRFCSRSCAGTARQRVRIKTANSNWRGGKTFHPLYALYNDMLARCARDTHPRWASYGGRGITVCDRWRDDFWAFVEDMGERPPGRAHGRALFSLDRIDNDGPYAPGNCRWATNTQQRANRRDSVGASA